MKWKDEEIHNEKTIESEGQNMGKLMLILNNASNASNASSCLFEHLLFSQEKKKLFAM